MSALSGLNRSISISIAEEDTKPVQLYRCIRPSIKVIIICLDHEGRSQNLSLRNWKPEQIFFAAQATGGFRINIVKPMSELISIHSVKLIGKEHRIVLQL